MLHTTDVLVLGGGMAGVSLGYELAADRHVTVLDKEPALAFHTTGRSAALFLETYGGPVIRALTVASRGLFEQLDLLTPMASLFLGLRGHGDAIEQLYRDTSALVPDVELLTPEQAAQLQPLLRADRLDNAVLEPSAREIDVAGLHQFYVRGLRERGSTTTVSAGAVAATRTGGTSGAGGTWTVTDDTGRSWEAPVVVNAAGSWADEVGNLFGARGIGLQALRRSAFIVDAPPDTRAPMFGDVPATFYAKPDAGRLLCSPADETPQAPGDARPDELEIARALDVINDVTTLDLRHVRQAWGGLRSFVADRTPVVCHDPVVDGLFWCAGQGGYGIQTAPALARTGAALLRGEPVPQDVASVGTTAGQLAADRASLTR